MSPTTTEVPRLNKRDLKGWESRVGELFMHVVNNLGVQYRIIDGSHLLLFPPDGSTRPVKFSASRSSKDSERYIALFIERHASRQQREFEQKEESARKLAADQQELALKRAAEEAEQRRAEMAEARAVEPPVAPKISPEKDLRPVVAGRVQYITVKDKTPVAVDTDGEHYWCMYKDCEAYSTDVRGTLAHQRSVHEERGLGGPQKKEVHQRAIDARQKNAEERRVARHAAIEALAEAVGYDLDSSNTDRLTKKVENLTQQVDDLKKERDALKAKLAEIREAIRS